MKLNPKAQIVKGKPVCTSMVISAHQDDIEIMCPMGMVDCYKKADKGLVAVVVTDGGGSPRAGKFADFTYDEMVSARAVEQANAAKIADYSDLIMLFYTSSQIKDKANKDPEDDLYNILMEYRPETLYMHNLADKHATHIGVAMKTLSAVRRMPKEMRPKKLYGCECWRDLDWLSDNEKVIFDITGYDDMLMEALRAHVSQIEGGKGYDAAVQGRRVGHATFSRSHSVDTAEQLALAMDLTPLVEDDNLNPKDFLLSKIDIFKSEILF